MSFENLVDGAHTETVSLTFSGTIDDMAIYDEDMGLTASGNPVIFPLTISETEYFYVIYSGEMTDVTYNNAPNITARILHEQPYEVLSEDLCNLIDYNITREQFNHNFKFKLGDCEISLHGAEPPQATVVARKVPVLIKSTDVERGFLNIMVW